MKDLNKFCKIVLLFPFLILGELNKIMGMLQDLKDALGVLSTSVDQVLANESADASAVTLAQAAQKAAEDAEATAVAQLATVQGELATAQADAVDQASLDAVKAIQDKLTPPAPAPVVDPAPPAA